MKQARWYDILQYVAMILMAAAMPVSWQLGLWMALALAAVSFVKLLFSRRVGNPALGSGLRWSLYAVLAYWLVYLISMLYSLDTATAWTVVSRKAVLLIFPLCFLLTDTTYLTPRHLRGLGYALLAAVCGVFIYFAYKALSSVSDGTSWVVVTGERFDARHHSYYALYAVVALCFVYSEIADRWKETKWWLRGLLIVSVPMLLLYILLVNSRAGVLAMILLLCCCLLYQAVARRRWLPVLLVGALLVGGVYGMTHLLPGHKNRLGDTMAALKQGKEGDVRARITHSAVHAFSEQPVIGYGAGDYGDVLKEQFYIDDEGVVGRLFNAHNQYMETLLAVGIVGMIPFLAFLLLPVILGVYKRSRNGFTLAICASMVLLNLVFESMLERQMGLLFIGYLYSIMVLILSLEQNKFGRVQKS